MRLNLDNYPPYPQPIIYSILSAQFISFIVKFKTKNYLKFLLNLIRQTVLCLFNYLALSLSVRTAPTLYTAAVRIIIPKKFLISKPGAIR